MTDEVMMIRVNDAVAVRGRGVAEVAVDDLCNNAQAFLQQVGRMIESTPESQSGFQLTEVTVSAEVSASGKLVLLGSGAEAAGKGVLTFKFERRSNDEKSLANNALR